MPLMQDTPPGQNAQPNGHNHTLGDGAQCPGSHDNSHLAANVPVVIVGAGPSGLLQAYLLSKLNIQCMIIERYSTRLAAPKAHAINPRSLEICRQFGLDTKAIRSLGTPRSEAFWVNFITSLSGETVGRLPYERMDADVLDATPEMIHNIPQPAFEEFVAQHLPKSVQILRNASFVSSEERDDFVYTTYEDRKNGNIHTVASKYLIACDGAKSKVRRFLGIECDGEDSYETMMTIHFNTDLRPVVGERVGMLHWVMDPAVSGFVIAYDLGGNQVLICNIDPKKLPAEQYTESHCREIISAAIGRDTKFDILSFRPWVLSRNVAQHYRQGRVFLAGDAAHAFPPTGGLGLNTGLADVHNLAYKIAAAYHGWASDGLLDTYQADRRHIANVNALQSIKNGKRIFGLLRASGTATGDVEEARQNFALALKDPKRRAWIDEEIELQQEHFDNLELHIGYVYGSTDIPPHASHYTPQFVRGARLPHVWIEPSSSLTKSLPPAVDLRYVPEMEQDARQRRQYSVLDLCSCSAFTLIGAKDTSFFEKNAAALDLLGEPRVPVDVLTYGEDFSITVGKDNWLQSTGLHTGGAVLIRPDQHILAVLPTEADAASIANILANHLGRSQAPLSAAR